MIIRAALDVDLDAIRVLQIASWRRSYPGLVPEGYLDGQVEHDLAKVWRARPDAPDNVLVASEGDRIVGFLTLRFPLADHPLVDNLHVAPLAKRRGIGRSLMVAAARDLGEQGQVGLWLTVLEGNTAARAFYQSLGGQEGPVFDDRMLGQPVRSVRVDWSDLAALAAMAAEPSATHGPALRT